MGFEKSTIRRIGFLSGWERYDSTNKDSEMDDLSCTITIICNFLITILTPFYYKTLWKRRKMGLFQDGQRTLNHLGFILFIPSIFCLTNTSMFLIELIIFSDIEPEQYEGVVLVMKTVWDLFLVIFKKLYDVFIWIFIIYLFVFSCLVRFYIILLAVQRFVVSFFPDSLHCLVSTCVLRIYIFIGWLLTLLYKFVAFFMLYGYTQNRQKENTEKLYRRVNIATFGTVVFVSLIYIGIFVKLFKMPRFDKCNRPEVALLYEGIPLFVVHSFILYYVQIELNDPHFYSHYMNYEMRQAVISTALVQFTYVITFQKIIRFFSHDVKTMMAVAQITPFPVQGSDNTV